MLIRSDIGVILTALHHRLFVEPLLLAAERGHEAVVQLLLAHAAVDPNQARQDGVTPLYMAAQNGHEAVVRLLLALCEL